MNYKYILTAILVMAVFSGTASAWLTGYDHRMAITVNNGGASSLSHYQFNFTNDTNVLVSAGEMQASGADCRITDASDNLLPFWNETPFNAAGTLVWVNATTLAVGDNTFYMYYGNAGASSASNGANTFELFDDFDGATSPVDSFANDLAKYGASPDIFNPTGTYYNGRTYVVVAHEKGNDPYAIYYNHSTGTWSDQVFVGTNPYPAGDSHGHPSILRDATGHLHIFYGGGGYGMRQAKSTNADDISSWVDKGTIIDGGGCPHYPHPVLRTNGDIYLFITHDDECDMAYTKSTDNGETWSALNTILDLGSLGSGDAFKPAKTEYESNPERWQFAWAGFHQSDQIYYDVYYAYFNFSDGHMYNITGVDLGTTIDKNESYDSCRVYACTPVMIVTVHLDSSGVPYILFNDNSTFRSTYWNGSSWTSPQTITTTAPVSSGYGSWDSLDFIVHNSTSIEAYLEVYGNIEKWSWNGTAWSFISTIVNTSTHTGLPCVVANYNNEIKVLFSEHDVDSMQKGYAYGDGGLVGGLVGSLDTTMWSSSANVSLANSKVTIDGALGEIYSNTNYSAGHAIRGYGKLHDQDTNGQASIGWNNDAQDSEYMEIYSYNQQAGANNLTCIVQSTNLSSTNLDELESASYRKWDIMWLNSSSVKFRVDDGSVKEITTNIPSGTYPLNLCAKRDTDVVEFDWVLIRNYASPEPAATLGAEETGGGGCGAYNITLPLGWSIIGWTNPTASTAHSMGTLIGANCQYVTERNSTTGLYVTHVMSNPTEDNFATERGWGYFVKTTAETLWERDS